MYVSSRNVKNINFIFRIVFVITTIISQSNGFSTNTIKSFSPSSISKLYGDNESSAPCQRRFQNAIVPVNSYHSHVTKLSSVAGPSLIASVVSGGLLGGALHAIAGPDHLAALLPRCCGQRWYRAGKIGALWGMGHGFSATFLGLTAFGLKNKMTNMNRMKGILSGASSAMEIAVGASLILIGMLGIKEAREWEEEIEAAPQSLSAAAVETGMKQTQKRAVLFNGILHGFSWDGAPSLAPALAVATWSGSISFLLAYAVGTMGAMTLTTTLIGESTRRAGEIFHRPDLPQKLSFISSILAMAVGLFWCFLAFK